MVTLDDFEESEVRIDGVTRTLYRRGSGPAVIVMAEIPGITPLVLSFADQVAQRGLTVVLPVLFGTPGKAPSTPYAVRSLLGACVSKEFRILASDASSPITTWLRGLARIEHERCGGPGVGAIGMCLTGGFALAMMVDDVVVAPVLSQPSLPAPFGARRQAALGLSASELERVRARVNAGTCVLGLRFTGDPAVRAARFDTLRTELGDGFIGVEIDSSEGNPWGHRRGAHSVLTEDLQDAPGTPTRAALEQVLDFFSDRLVGSG